MKLKPQQYAQMLINISEEDSQTAVPRFWRLLQKNKQYRDLAKILEAIDEEYAKKNNAVLIKVFSEKDLPANKADEISEKISQKYQKKVFLKNIVKSGISGLIIKIDDKIIDLSAEDKARRLKEKIST